MDIWQLKWTQMEAGKWAPLTINSNHYVFDSVCSNRIKIQYSLCLDKIGCDLTQLQNIIATKSQGGSWSFAEKDDYKNFQPIGE